MKKVVIIEDDIHIISAIREILDSSGFEVHAIENAEHAILPTKRILPDVILCQYSSSLPHEYCIISGLRESQETMNIPILLLIQQLDTGNIRGGFDLGADDYLIYPFEAKELLSIINARIKRYEQQILQINFERHKNHQLQRDLDVSHQKIQEIRHFNLIKANLIGRISTDLRDPISNINMAIRMLNQCDNSEEKTRYLTILESECAREIQILNEVDTLHSILTLDNMEVLNRFSLLSA
jgi:two-component system, OmpR family, alkaline phosphatase synthesis response regulator PhoP